MKYKPHIQLHHAIGISRVKACIPVCYFAPVLTGTIFSNRFNNSFDTLLKSMV